MSGGLRQCYLNDIKFVCIFCSLFPLNFFGIFNDLLIVCEHTFIISVELEFKFATHNINIQNTMKVKDDDFEFYQVLDAKIQ